MAHRPANDFEEPCDEADDTESAVPGDVVDSSRTQWTEDEGVALHVQATRPQTLDYALADSPAGMAGWMLEKFRAWTDKSHSDGEMPVSMEHLLTKFGGYWFSETITSSLRMYKESAESLYGHGVP